MSDTNDAALENTPETFEQLIEEANDFKNKYYSAVAENRNIKHRAERDKQQAIKFANEKILKELLETVDNLENSMQIEMPDDIRVGFDLVLKKLLTTLANHGISVCETKEFNPHFHEAVSQANVEGMGPNLVLEVLRKGYTLNDRLLRPASVIVTR